MVSITILEENIKALEQYLNKHPSASLVETYLAFVEQRFHLRPVVYPKGKVIYRNAEEAIKAIEEQNQLWRQAEIKISFGQESVNAATKKIYICPFTGKVFGDNTHPNPQDAIYDWVSKCPENKERVGGVRVKRFFVSDDPKVIANYLSKERMKAPITKIVYSSVINGKIFSSKEAVIEDFVQNYLKPISLMEVQRQDRHQIEENFLDFIQEELEEKKIRGFIENLAERDSFRAAVESWLS